MHEVEVNVVEPELGEGLRERGGDGVVPVLRELGRHEELGAGDARVADRFADRLFVHYTSSVSSVLVPPGLERMECTVSSRGVEVSVARRHLDS